MEKISDRLKKSLGQLGFVFLLCLSFFGMDIFIEYATDTYAVFQNLNEVVDTMIRYNSRIIVGVVFQLWYWSGIENETFYYISYFVAICMLVAAVFLLQDILRNMIKNEFLRIAISFVTIANAYIIEYFMFIEKGLFIFAVFFNVAAFFYMFRFFQDKRKRNCFLSFLCLACAMFTYQGTVGLFVVLCLPFAYRYAVNMKIYIQNMCYTMLVYGSACMMDYFVLTFVFKSTKLKDSGLRSDDLLANLVFAIKGLVQNTMSTCGILPKYVFIVSICLVIIVSLVGIAVRSKGKIACIQLLNLIILFAGTAVASTSTIIMGSGWFAARVIYPYASMFGIFLINFYVNIFDDHAGNRFYKYANVTMGLIVITFLFIQNFQFHKIAKDKYLTNYTDKYRCEMIEESIHNYEQKTNVKLQYISFYRDGQPDIQYDGLFHQGDLVVSSFITDWSDLAAINYYSNETYMRGEVNPKYQTYFSGKDWKIFSEEQLIFDGDTLHFCVY